MNARVLVLDAGGVLLAEPIPDLLAAMAESGGTSLADVTTYFEQTLYYPLWSGRMPPEEFWALLRRASGAAASGQYWESYFLDRLRPTAAHGAARGTGRC